MEDNPFQVHADVIQHYDPSDLNRKISDEQDFIVSAPPSTTYVPRGSGDIVPNNKRSALPDLARKTAQQKRKFAAAQLAKGFDGSEESTAKLFAELEECAASVTSKASPNTLNKRTLILARWNTMINQHQPSWPEDRFWDFGVVHDYAKLFLPYLIKNIGPKSRFNTTIKSRTLDNWCTIFIVLIGNFTIEPGTLEKAGQKILATFGLYNYLRDQVVHLVHKHKLDRHYEPRQYLGREHLALVFNTMLSSSKQFGRQVAIQNMVRLAITFFTTARGSTQGPTHIKWRELGYFIKLKHVRVFRRSENTWSVVVFFGEFKCAIGTTHADEQIHTLEGVLHAHNVLFDPTVALIAHLFLRDVFAKKYKTIEDLCNDNSAELCLDPNMLEQPLFLASEVGGRDFIVPYRAAMSQSASDSSSYWTKQAGLPRAGVTAWRRDAGNMYGLQLGESIAKDLMNHTTVGVFRESYSRNTNNISTVGIRLGEVAGTKETTPGEMLEKNAVQHMFLNTAIECIVRCKGADPVKTKKDEKANIKAFVDRVQEIRDLQATLDHDWNAYLTCFNNVAKSYKPVKSNANRMYNTAAGIIPHPIDEGPEIAFRPGKAAKAKSALDNLIKLFAKIVTRRQYWSRKERERRTTDKSHSMIKMGASGTTEEREAAAIESMKTSSHLTQALTDQTRRSLEWSPSTDPSVWSASLTRERHLEQESAEATALAVMEDEELELDDSVKRYDRMLANFISGGRAREDITLPEGIEHIPEKDTDAEIPADCSGPEIEESQEIDILQVPVSKMRRAMLEYLVAPVLYTRLLEQYKVDDEEIAEGCSAGFRCPKCKRYTHRTPVPCPVFPNVSELHRHFAYQHSEWKEMELDMIKPNSTKFHCPAGDFSANKAKSVWTHAISDSCDRQQQHIAMSEAHHTEIKEKHIHQPRDGAAYVRRGVRAVRASRLSPTDSDDDVGIPSVFLPVTFLQIAQPCLHSYLEEFKAIRDQFYVTNPGFSRSQWLAPEVAQPCLHSALDDFKAMRNKFYQDNASSFSRSQWQLYPKDAVPDVSWINRN